MRQQVAKEDGLACFKDVLAEYLDQKKSYHKSQIPLYEIRLRKFFCEIQHLFTPSKPFRNLKRYPHIQPNFLVFFRREKFSTRFSEQLELSRLRDRAQEKWRVIHSMKWMIMKACPSKHGGVELTPQDVA